MNALLPCVLSILSLPAAGSPDVLVVAADGGGEYSDIQPAVDAASEGNLLLVEDGTYSPFTIRGKSLSVFAESGAAPVIAGPFGATVAVEDLAANQTVRLRGLRVEHGDWQGFPRAAFYASSNDGAVIVEECSFSGGFALGGVEIAGAEVRDCDSITFARCALAGSPQSSQGFGENRGLRAMWGSRVFLYDCAVEGGGAADQAQCYWVDSQCVPSIGADAIELNGGFLLLSGCTVRGGDGGDGAPAQLGYPCAPGGNGGDGVSASVAEIHLVDSVVEPGQGGSGEAPCGDGGDGQALDPSASTTIEHHAGPARSIAATTPHREGETLTLSLHGGAGEIALYGIGAPSIGAWTPAWEGVLSIPAPIVVEVVGELPPAGVLVDTFPVPVIPGSALAGLTLAFQPAFVSPGSGAIRLGSPSVALLLDSGV